MKSRGGTFFVDIEIFEKRLRFNHFWLGSHFIDVQLKCAMTNSLQQQNQPTFLSEQRAMPQYKIKRKE